MGERGALRLAEAQGEPEPDARGEGLPLPLAVPHLEKEGVPEVVGEGEGERDA